MAIKYRVKFETYDDLEPSIAIKSKEVMDEVLSKPTNGSNYGMVLRLTLFGIKYRVLSHAR